MTATRVPGAMQEQGAQLLLVTFQDLFFKATCKTSVNPQYSQFLTSILTVLEQQHMIHRNLLKKHLVLAFFKS